MRDEMIRIAITGPECTGKSTLASQLAAHYHTIFIPEYARDYIAGLTRPYTYEDVVHIAENQVKQAERGVRKANKVLFLDTYLVITKVWFEVVYGRYPSRIDDELVRHTIDLYLLCDTSIPWFADHVRENGGAMREELFKRYKSELENLGSRYAIISSTGDQRLNQAIYAVDHFFPDICPK